MSLSPLLKVILFFLFVSEVVFEKAYCEYRLNRVESALKTIEGAPEQTDKLKELYGQVVRLCVCLRAAGCCSYFRSERLVLIGASFVFSVQLYRLERFTECKSVYTDLIRNSQDEYEEERKTNLSAVVASMSQWENAPLVRTAAA